MSQCVKGFLCKDLSRNSSGRTTEARIHGEREEGREKSHTNHPRVAISSSTWDTGILLPGENVKMAAATCPAREREREVNAFEEVLPSDAVGHAN